jgi:hypothetical protein
MPMDRATRNFLALAAISLTLAAYGFCGFVGYGILPVLEGRMGAEGVGPMAVVGLGIVLSMSLCLAA